VCVCVCTTSTDQ